MEEKDRLAARFAANRAHLLAVAYRMLGSESEADDAVQEAWLRFCRADTSEVSSLGGWLTTVVARVCLDVLRARKSQRHEPADQAVEEVEDHSDGKSPEQAALLADSVGLALLVVLETLAPTERLAFVLHDLFDLPFVEIATIVGCSPVAARQLASRARRRVRGASADPEADADLAKQREVIDAFLLASRGGDFAALLALLDPDVVVRADRTAVEMSVANRAQGAPLLAPEIRGAAAVVETFSKRARGAEPALINGSMGAAWAPGGQPRVVFGFTVAGGKILGIEVIADPARLVQLDVAVIDHPGEL